MLSQYSLFLRTCFIFKKTFHCVLFSVWNFRIKMLFLIPVYSCSMICLTRCSIFGMRYAREVAYWGCGMLGMWDVGDVGCWGCGMFGMWDVRDVGCSGCGMFEMWDVHDVGCWFKKCLSVVVCICKIHAFNGVIASQIIPNFWNRSPDRMDVFETFTGGRYHRDMKILKILTSKCKHFRFYAIF